MISTRPRLALGLAVVLAAASASAQAPPDSVPPRPPFSVPFESDYFEPPQTSAALAYVYSVAATGGLVLLGVAVLKAAPESGELASTGPDLSTVGVGLVLSGVWLGPSVGNLSLGAPGDVRRAMYVKIGGFAGGVGLGAAALVVGLTCLADGLGGSTNCAAEPLATGLLIAGFGVAALGTVAGAVYDLATIPLNAALARRYRRQYGAALAPGYSVPGRAPVLALRVRF